MPLNITPESLPEKDYNCSLSRHSRLAPETGDESPDS